MKKCQWIEIIGRMSKRNILIFGGAGFIGTHFFDYLNSLNSNLNVRLFDIEGNGEFIDVRKLIEIDGKFSSDDVVINLAAVHTTPGHPDHEYFETNIRGAENVCEFAERLGINNIIFTSSIAPYGASENLKTEETLPTPNTPYGISKLVAEHIHKEWVVRNPKNRLMILRPGVVFGKGENGNFTRLAKALMKGVFFYPGRKDTIKGCIYVKELVHQSWEIFQKQKAQTTTYNFAYEPAYSIEDIARNIALVLGVKPPTILLPALMLKIAARTAQLIGLAKIGIHPDRVKKLMTSTNVSGAKLKEQIKYYKYPFEEALNDWYIDCDKQGLF